MSGVRKGKRAAKPPRRSAPRGVLSTRGSVDYDDLSSFEDPGLPPPTDSSAFVKFEQTFDADADGATEQLVEAVSATPADMSLVHSALQDHIATWVPTSRAELRDALLPHIDIVSRADEEAMMRMAKGHEMACERGEACEGLKIFRQNNVPDPGPLLAAHTTEQKRVAAERKTALPPAPCWVCRRATAAFMIVTARCEGNYLEQPGSGSSNLLRSINSHGNIVGAPGEYDESHIIAGGTPETHGASWPIVAHVRSKYDPYYDADRRVMCLAQRGYTKPAEPVQQDFRQAANQSSRR